MSPQQSRSHYKILSELGEGNIAMAEKLRRRVP
jgi:hypothetical protein